MEENSKNKDKKMTMTNKLKSNVVINIILIIIYVYFFGQHSLKRFLDKSVIITEHEEKQELIDPPGILQTIHIYLSFVI